MNVTRFVLSPLNILFGDSTTRAVKLAKEICFQSERCEQWEERIQNSTRVRVRKAGARAGWPHMYIEGI